MTAWKTTTALAAAMLLTAGIGTGIGISLGQGEKPEAVAAANAPQPEPPKAPVKPAAPEKPKDSPESLATREREAKLKGLRTLVEETGARLQKLQNFRDALRGVALQKMDPKVISDAITKLDAESLENEEKLADWTQRIADATESHKAATAYKPTPGEIQLELSRYSAVNKLMIELENREMQLRDLQTKFAVDHPEIKKARAEFDEYARTVKSELEAARPNAVLRLVEARTAVAASEVRNCRNGANNLTRLMAQKKQRRDQLVQQLQSALQENNRTASVEREIEQVQRTQDELRRMLMMLEFGIPGDVSTSANDRITRELAELREEVRRLNEKK